MTTGSQRRWLALLSVLMVGALAFGCDQVSRPEVGQPPSVSELTVVPDSATRADLTEAPGADSLAPVVVTIGATATDPDGTVERVVFTIEPSSSPRGTASGTLQLEQDAQYRRTVRLGVPVFLDEVYTVRVFAVDDDSLASNQSLGRFRFEPDD